MHTYTKFDQILFRNHVLSAILLGGREFDEICSLNQEIDLLTFYVFLRSEKTEYFCGY